MIVVDGKLFDEEGAARKFVREVLQENEIEVSKGFEEGMVLRVKAIFAADIPQEHRESLKFYAMQSIIRQAETEKILKSATEMVEQVKRLKTPNMDKLIETRSSRRQRKVELKQGAVEAKEEKVRSAG